MKSIFGSSAVIAVTILSTSFLLSAKPSVAETFLSSFQSPKHQVSQTSKQDPKQDPAGSGGSSNATSATDGTTKATTEDIAGPTWESAAPKSASTTPVATAASKANTSLTSGADSTATPATAGVIYSATAYSLSGRTASGIRVTKGLIAADPRVLPLGTRVRLDAGSYSGEYVVADTGGAVRGKKIDIWTPNSRE